jgi:hypothetical protein
MHELTVELLTLLTVPVTFDCSYALHQFLSSFPNQSHSIHLEH